jgi:hypothetical protein
VCELPYFNRISNALPREWKRKDKNEVLLAESHNEDYVSPGLGVVGRGVQRSSFLGQGLYKDSFVYEDRRLNLNMVQAASFAHPFTNSPN